MIVYHGSYCVVDCPHIKFSRDSLDFGKGFYVTSIEEQAVNWASRFKLRGKNSCINRYSLDLECRNGSNIYLENDIIIGGIADDRVYNTIELYEDRLITKEGALNRLKYYKPNEQICIVNQEIIDKFLKYEGSKDV